uniref:G-protein coupled receptors family 3 profile domain-containing protein n=1 Tax=Denticeps clupeoides TaxID=299321 RepID=A0AAY4DRC2_9TELE
IKIAVYYLLRLLSSATVCVLQGDFELPWFIADGDFTIGGIFPIHYRVEMPHTDYAMQPKSTQCKGFDPRAFRWAQAMRLAVEEINNRTDLLPNHKLGYKIFDSCATPVTAQKAILAVLNGQETAHNVMCSGASPLLAIVGESGSSQSIVVSRTLQPFRIPMISYFSTCSCLSDRAKYPTFFRVVPNDDYQVKAIARLLKHFGWKWIGVITEDHDYGRFALQGLKRELENTDICLAYHEMIPKDYRIEKVLQILDVMRTSSAKVVVVFSGEGEFYPFLKEFMNQNITGIQWIASEAWVTASVLAESYPFLDGTIGFAIRKGYIQGLKDYLLTVDPWRYPSNPLVHELWEALFGCSTSSASDNSQLLRCTGNENLMEHNSAYMNTSSPRVTYNVYKAVYAIAHSLHGLINCIPGKGPFQNSCSNLSDVHPWQVLLKLQHYIQEVSFTTSVEKIHFDQKGDAVPSYDLINWQRSANGQIEFVTVGLYDGAKHDEKELFIQEEALKWTGERKEVLVSVCSESCPRGFRKAVRQGKPLCCFDCVPCDSGKISNQTNSVDCIPCPEDFWSNTDGTQCIPKVVEFLSHDAMGMTLTVIAVAGACLTLLVLAVFFHFRNTPIVRLNNSELSFFILLSLTLCFLCALVFIGEPTSWSCMLRHTAFSITFSLCISCILGKTLVVLGAFTATRPGNDLMKWLGPRQQRVIIFSCTLVQVVICAAWLISAPPFPLRNTQYQRSKIILECSEGSELAFWCVLGYIGLLACLCFVLAFLARKLPGNFNEAKYITFSMLIFCAVWLAFIPAYVSSPGKFTVAVEIFAILASSFGLLLCLFAPKCYIILLKPEKNTKQHLMGKSNDSHHIQTWQIWRCYQTGEETQHRAKSNTGHGGVLHQP